jgi:hypothetical protein
MEHVGAWSGAELKSDALIVAIVVVAVVGYVAASGRSASPAAKNRRNTEPVPFRKVLQENVIQSGKNGKVYE